ncbi:MAG: RAD55 family ATPase [Candidatus Eisenbacteria bacterium]
MELMKTGIPGFDAATGGGIPRGTRTILYGPPGTGKTVFGMHFLWEGMTAGEVVACNTADRPFEQVRRYFRSFGWDVAPHEREGRLAALQSFPRFSQEQDDSGVDYVRMDDLDALHEIGARLRQRGVTRFVSGDFSQALYSVLGPEKIIPLLDWQVNWAFHSGAALIEVVTATQVDLEGHKGWSLSLKAAHNVIQFRNASGRREIRILKLEGASHPLDWVPIAIGSRGIEMGIV